MVKCKICGRTSKNYNGFATHIRTHNISAKTYYDTYLKKSNEGFCQLCRKETRFVSMSKGYSKYCSITCVNKSDIHKDKIAKTKLDKYGNPYYRNTEKAINTYKETCKNRTKERKQEIGNNIRNAFNNFSESKKQQISERISIRQKEYYANLSDLDYKKLCENRHNTAINRTKESWKASNNKSIQTKIANNSIITSKIENNFYQSLLNIFPSNDIIHTYYDTRYPFACDFYIKSLDLFIEIHNHWTHGSHKFNKNNEEDINRLNMLIERSSYSDFYKVAIYVWTKLDIKKYNIAKKNKLNYVTLYNQKEIDTFLEGLGNETKSRRNKRRR